MKCTRVKKRDIACTMAYETGLLKADENGCFGSIAFNRFWEEVERELIPLYIDEKDDNLKARALEEIRHRVETATDGQKQAKLLVLEKAIETDMSLETVGQVINEAGNVFGYAFGLFETDAEAISDPTTYIWVSPLGRSVKAFARCAIRLNQAMDIDEHQKEACIKLIYTYLGLSV